MVTFSLPVAEDSPQIGDYVIIHSSSGNIAPDFDSSRSCFLDEIGQIVDRNDKDIYWHTSENSIYSIKYTNVPKDITQILKRFATYKIKNDEVIIQLLGRSIAHWSKDREDLELILTAKKYNI